MTDALTNLSRLAEMWAELDPVDDWRPHIRDAIDELTRLRAAFAAPAAPPDAMRDAELWRYVATHWTHADFRWNRDAGNTPKSVTVTIKAGPAAVGSDGGQFMRFISECVAAAPTAQQEPTRAEGE